MKVERIVSNYLDSNVFVLTKEKDALIIDAGADIEKVAAAVEGKRVCGVLLTHGHYDHSLFAKEYAKEFNCKIFCSKNALVTLADGEANYSEGQFKITDFSNFITLDDGQIIQLGDFEVKAILTQGHCKCAMCYLIGSSLFAGDTLFEKGIGRTDLIGSSKEDMLASLEKLENVDFGTCYSGHGESSTKEEQQTNIALFKRFLLRRK